MGFASSMGIEKSLVNSAIEQVGLEVSIRPEQLSMEQFIRFAEELNRQIDK